MEGRHWDNKRIFALVLASGALVTLCYFGWDASYKLKDVYSPQHRAEYLSGYRNGIGFERKGISQTAPSRYRKGTATDMLDEPIDKKQDFTFPQDASLMKYDEAGNLLKYSLADNRNQEAVGPEDGRNVVNLRKTYNRTHLAHNKIKTILFWNYYYHWKTYRFGLGVEPFFSKCGMDSCRTTLDKSEITTADAVVFYGRMLSSAPYLPVRSNPKQIFIFFNTESPVKSYGQMKRLGLEINMTITYRADSTIHHPYGLYEPKSSESEPYTPMSVEGVRQKNKTVAWMVSRCTKPGTIRIEYVKELSKHIPVDIYGKCGNLTCGKTAMDDCMTHLESNYKFYLAFENSICEGYVTEKAFRTLTYNLVPVVMGGTDYSKILPPHSYIDIKNFTSPQSVAEFLKYLDDNPEEYLKYFEWKHHYTIVRLEDTRRAFCKLCETLNSQEQYHTNFNVSSWWEGDSCIWPWEKDKMGEEFHLTL